jgi:hypothetical protein
VSLFVNDIPRVLLTLLLLPCLGCSGLGVPLSSQSQPVTNPMFVASTNEELVWERAIDVLHDFQFEIAQENRLGKVIETAPKPGAGLLEPWHPDSVDLPNRLESSLQSVRRIVQISFQPSDQQPGYMVTVAAYKEIEDLPGVAANSPGAATFSESTPLQRDLDSVVGQSAPSEWIRVGRDLALEQALLSRLFAVYSL